MRSPWRDPWFLGAIALICALSITLINLDRIIRPPVVVGFEIKFEANHRLVDGQLVPVGEHQGTDVPRSPEPLERKVTNE